MSRLNVLTKEDLDFRKQFGGLLVSKRKELNLLHVTLRLRMFF